MAEVYQKGGKGKWYGVFLDVDGRRRPRCTGCADKRAAERIQRKWEADAALRREGVVDMATERLRLEAMKPIAEHVEAFGLHLRTGGAGEKHVASTLIILNRMTLALKIQTLADLTADAVNRYAAGEANRPSRLRQGKPLSARTVHWHLTAIKSFSAWLEKGGKLLRDPLRIVRKPNPQREERRRALLRDELPWLWEATLAGPTILKLTGEERRRLYWTALCTGFRANELRSLERSALRRPNGRPVLFLSGKATKNDDDAWIDIPEALARSLEEGLAAAPRRTKLLKTPVFTVEAQMLDRDLAAARAAWIAAAADDAEREEREGSTFLDRTNDAGEVLDFHSLRHTYGAWQVEAGVPIQDVQKRMRHKSITQTIDHYGHLAPGREADACDALAAVMGGSLVAPVERAARRTTRNGANGCEAEAGSGWKSAERKGFGGKGFRESSPSVAKGCEDSDQSSSYPYLPMQKRLNDPENAFETGVSRGAVAPVERTDAALNRLTALWPSLTADTKAALLFLAEGAARPQTPEPAPIETASRLPAAEPALRPKPRGKGVQA